MESENGGGGDRLYSPSPLQLGAHGRVWVSAGVLSGHGVKCVCRESLSVVLMQDGELFS